MTAITSRNICYTVHNRSFCENVLATNAGTFLFRRKEEFQMRVTLTKDFRKISTSYGLFQNLSGDADVELTENAQSEGIILRPFQIVTVNRTVWARRRSGMGTGVLAVLPFVDSEETSDENSDNDTNGDTSENNPPLPPPPPPRPPAPPCECFEHEPFPKPVPPHCPPPPHHHPPHDDADSYIIKIPRALVESGQNKFVVDFSR